MLAGAALPARAGRREGRVRGARAARVPRGRGTQALVGAALLQHAQVRAAARDGTATLRARERLAARGAQAARASARTAALQVAPDAHPHRHRPRLQVRIPV